MNISSETFEVIPDPSRFDSRSGNALERLIFNHRRVILIVFALVSIFLGWRSTQLTINANFERMIPRSHPYIQNYLDNKTELRGLGNQLRVVVENTQGDIYDPEYLKFLASDQRCALHHAGRRPAVAEVAVDAGAALGRGDRGGHARRPGDARALRRLAGQDRGS